MELFCRTNIVLVIKRRALRQESNAPNPPKLLLYDEADKFLDPILIKIALKELKRFVDKHNCQVVMVTHRPDTIAILASEFRIEVEENAERARQAVKSPHQDVDGFQLASPQSIPKFGVFIMNRQREQEKIDIIEVTPITAMYRLTRGFREFSGHHLKVYTESTDDALFYEGVYDRLMQICENIPQEQREAERNWKIDEQTVGRLLSRRYQLGFQSISKKKKASGGCKVVIDKATRDCNAYVDREYIMNSSSSSIRRSLLSHREFHLPYGIVDNDGKDHKKDDIHARRIVVPRPLYRLGDPRNIWQGGRYSLENFVFDPIILCSVLSVGEITDWINKSVKIL